jgi:hypothetical protein
MTCPDTGLICEKFSFGGGAITTYACTQTCASTAGCGTAPAGYTVQCLPFTTESFCVVTCDPTSTNPDACPSPMKCVANEGQPVGICVSL